jgi:hypothetical protein
VVEFSIELTFDCFAVRVNGFLVLLVCTISESYMDVCVTP